MGFNLKSFFAELQALIVSPDYRDDEARLKAVKEFVQAEKNYAEQCGQLR